MASRAAMKKAARIVRDGDWGDVVAAWDKDPDWWTSGGCWVAAEAFRLLFGGDVAVLVNDEPQSQVYRQPEHAGLLVQGVWLDALGARPWQEAQLEWQAEVGDLLSLERVTPHWRRKMIQMGFQQPFESQALAEAIAEKL